MKKLAKVEEQVIEKTKSRTHFPTSNLTLLLPEIVCPEHQNRIEKLSFSYFK